MITPTAEERREIRRIVRTTQANISVEVVPGYLSPVVVGERGHYENKKGDWIEHPKSYKWLSNLTYFPSTRRVEVGARWLAERRAAKQADSWCARLGANLARLLSEESA